MYLTAPARWMFADAGFAARLVEWAARSCAPPCISCANPKADKRSRVTGDGPGAEARPEDDDLGPVGVPPPCGFGVAGGTEQSRVAGGEDQPQPVVGLRRGRPSNPDTGR